MHDLSHRIGAGLFAAAAIMGTGYVLFSDVPSSGLTVDHVTSALVLVLALGAGHFVLPSWQRGKRLASIGLALAFVAATVVIVTGSAGRNADVAKTKAAAAARLIAEREQVAKDVSDARAAHADLKSDAARECRKVGPQCQRKGALVEAAWSHVLLLEARLSSLPPEQATGGKTRAFAELLHELGLVSDRTRAERVLGLVMPYALALAFEIAALAFGSILFPPIRGSAVPVPANSNAPVPPVPPHDRMDSDRTQVIDWVREFRARYGRNPQIPEVQRRFRSVPKTSAWRYIKAA